MAMVRRAFFDTSVLLAGLVDFGPGSRHAFAAMGAVAGGRVAQACTAWHCCLEFYSVGTRLPDEYRLSPADAVALLEDGVFPRFEIGGLPGSRGREFLRRAAGDKIVGGRIYDEHIGEVAIHMKAGVIVTENRRHFGSLLRHDIRVLSAEEFVSE